MLACLTRHQKIEHRHYSSPCLCTGACLLPTAPFSRRLTLNPRRQMTSLAYAGGGSFT
ncbi:hypothetical protein BDY21DRAFT_336983 [Lineolata rhizophorae]|uniref:Uncharacterized protein n=1 Tax=Lineolata rhizophorae TaxID=578093 RepID=A0A6A6P7I2_9PEZI|nr:hypothetical protein BDY21DRAFT_336983 [Lineolata rhizophorae]